MDDISYYLTYDLPVPYRNLRIYPVRIKDYMHFVGFSQCLLLEKNYVPDVKIIAMTELEYIFHLTFTEPSKNPQLLWFDRMLALILKEEDSFKDFETSIGRYRYDEKGKPIFEIGGAVYTSQDFEEIKRIVCEQNNIVLPDENISKEVRDSLEAARKYKEKLSGTTPGSLEDFVVSLALVTGWTLEYVNEMTVRKFVLSLRRMDNFVHYKIYLSASLSGMVEFKDKSFIKHWLDGLAQSEDRYTDVSMNLDEIKGKVSLENAKTQEAGKYK